MTRATLALPTALFVLAALAAVPWFASTYYVGLLTELLIWALLALALDLMFGYVNLYSFGHAAPFGAAAYAAAMAVQYGHAGFWVAVAAGLAAGLAVGLVLALFAARSRGVEFIILTVLLSSVMFTLAHVMTGLTGGENGIYLAERLAILDGWPAAGTPYYWLVLTAVASSLALCRRVIGSPFGHVVLAIRENEARTHAMGYNTAWFKIGITMLSALLAGLAGTLNLFLNRYVSPEVLGVPLSTQVVIWTLFGGRGTLVGPMLGAVALVLISDVLSRLVSGYTIILGALFIAIVIFAPGGLISLARRAR